jgi:protein-S-isoprenylcysteine O-methyltransferase Ste14
MNQSKEHARIIVNPFIIIIASIVIAVLLQLLLPLPFLPPMTARIAGVALMVINVVFGVPALKKMFSAKTSPNPNQPTTALISSGPYRFTRNPMYIGLTLFYTGVVTFFQLLWGILMLPLVVILLTTLVIRPEEQYLERKFGGEYITYKERVRRWI